MILIFSHNVTVILASSLESAGSCITSAASQATVYISNDNVRPTCVPRVTTPYDNCITSTTTSSSLDRESAPQADNDR